MESLDEELFIDEGSVYSEESMSTDDGEYDLADDWSMESYLRKEETDEDDVDDVSEESSEWMGEEEEDSSSDDCDLSDGWSVEDLSDGDDELHPDIQARLEEHLESERLERKSKRTLHDIIHQMWRRVSEPQWDEMEDLMERNPLSARVTDKTGILPLYSALGRHEPKLSTIRALIAAYPQALSIKAPATGNLPLHCVAGTTDARLSVLRTVLYANEEAARMRNCDGELPIHKGCSSWGNVCSVWELLKFYPEGALETNDTGMTPMDVLMRSCRRVVLRDIPATMMSEPKLDQHRSFSWAMAMDASIDIDILFWADAQLLLMAEHHGKVPPIPPPEFFKDGCFITIDPSGIPGVAKFRPLHAALATGSHQALTELAMMLYPEQISEVDEEHGRLPLHWACRSKSHKTFYCYPCFSMKSATTWYTRGVSPLAPSTICEDCYVYGLRYAVGHGLDGAEGTQFKEGGKIWDHMPCVDILDFKPTSCDTVVERIAKAYPSAASVADRHNRFPLHYLVASLDRLPHPASLAAVIEASPAALERRDPVTGLLPIEAILMNSASKNPETEAEATEVVGIVYSVLRRNPGYLRSIV